jgi:hypothetical protein
VGGGCLTVRAVLRCDASIDHKKWAAKTHEEALARGTTVAQPRTLEGTPSSGVLPIGGDGDGTLSEATRVGSCETRSKLTLWLDCHLANEFLR